jgi:hypothetical protein
MSEMPKEQMQELVDALYERTRMDRLEWKKGFENKTFETKIASYFVQIRRAFDAESDEEYHEIVLKNAIGDELETIYPGHLHPLVPEQSGFQHYHQVFDSIFRMASRQALGVDKAIKDILSELKKS